MARQPAAPAWSPPPVSRRGAPFPGVPDPVPALGARGPWRPRPCRGGPAWPRPLPRRGGLARPRLAGARPWRPPPIGDPAQPPARPRCVAPRGPAPQSATSPWRPRPRPAPTRRPVAWSSVGVPPVRGQSSAGAAVVTPRGPLSRPWCGPPLVWPLLSVAPARRGLGSRGRGAPALRGPAACLWRAAWRVRGSASACARLVRDASARPCACVLAWCTVLWRGSSCPRRYA
jgi:hypothetical protein